MELPYLSQHATFTEILRRLNLEVKGKKGVVVILLIITIIIIYFNLIFDHFLLYVSTFCTYFTVIQ